MATDSSPKAVPLPGYAYHCHVGTENLSFIKVSRILAEKGVKNNKFMLALLDAELAEIDPFDDNLSAEMKTRVVAECIRNPWYFIREIVRIPVSGPSIHYELHLGNLFLTWGMIANINVYLLLPRQNYKTVSACAFYSWVYCFGSNNSHILFFNKELGDSKNNLKRVRNLIDELPLWLREEVLIDKVNDLNNIEYMQSGHRNNRIDAKPAGANPEHADRLGRGATAALKWYDEIAFAKYIKDTYEAAAPAGAQACVTAAKFGRPYGTCITTTPNMLSNESGAFAYRIRSGSLHFRLEFYDLGPQKVREMIESQAEFPFLYAEYTYKELGRSESWFRTQCRELLNNLVKIKREVLLVWPQSGEGSVFTEEQLDQVKQLEKPYVVSIPLKIRHFDTPPGLEFHFTKMPDPSVSYLVGLDTASGGGLDYTAFTFTDPRDMEAIGHIRTNSADDECVKAIADHIFTVMFPKSIAIIERNYLGIVVINHLLKKTQIEDRIFYLEKEKVAERVVGGGKTLKTKRKVKVYGIDTTAESREAMIRHLMQIVQELPGLLSMPKLQEELRTLHRTRSGKIEHRPGFHDDVLMSYLFCVYADRHEQPVLRKMLSMYSSPEKVVATVNHIANLNNHSQDAVPSSPEVVQSRVLTVESYTGRSQDSESARQRQMASMIASMNM